MLSRSFFPNFGQGPFSEIAGKSPASLFEPLKLKLYTHYFFRSLMIEQENKEKEKDKDKQYSAGGGEPETSE